MTKPAPRFVVLRLEVEDRVAAPAGSALRRSAARGRRLHRVPLLLDRLDAPPTTLVELCVERLPDGEVSGFLADVVEVGDELEVRGPIGGWFVWDGTAPALAVGGGTGVVPLVSMLRHANEQGTRDTVCLAAAARSLAELPYSDEIRAGCNVLALSRETSPSGRPPGHITVADLQPHTRDGQEFYVCGSAGFAESASRLLLDLGISATDVRVERFGPTR